LSFHLGGSEFSFQVQMAAVGLFGQGFSQADFDQSEMLSGDRCNQKSPPCGEG
jgi:hypothetical protein